MPNGLSFLPDPARTTETVRELRTCVTLVGEGLVTMCTQACGTLAAMKNAIRTTIDAAGRLVLPKIVRDEAGILPGMTLRVTVEEGKIAIEPVTREVRIVRKGPLRIAVPVDEGPPLTGADVEEVRREIRQRGE